MKRYTLLLIISFILLVMSVGGSVYLTTNVDKSKQEITLPFITVYTTMPMETLAPLAEEYENRYRIKVKFIPVNDTELFQKAKSSTGDLVLADSRLLQKLAAEGWLVPYFSETSDSIKPELKDINGFWTGVWYDPIVFCINADYARRAISLPMSWQELATDKKTRIGITDFLAADASANLLFTLVSSFGLENSIHMFQQLHPRVVQYSKYLSTPVRMAGMGEVDISIAVHSEAMHYINQEFPLCISYPSEGTACILTGTGVLLNAPKAEQAVAFANWLLGDEAYLALEKNNFFFVPTNRNTLAFKKNTIKNIAVLGTGVNLPKPRQQELLDIWVKNVRLKK